MKNNCPCCFYQLLRHIRNQEVYLFCRTCWQEMPDLSWRQCGLSLEVIRGELPHGLEKPEKANTTVYMRTK